MTHALGNGTRNIAVNLPNGCRDFLGQMATAEDKSIGRLIRELLVSGLENRNPDEAKRFKVILSAHWTAKMLTVPFAVFVWWQGVTHPVDMDAMRKPSSACGVRVAQRGGRRQELEIAES